MKCEAFNCPMFSERRRRLQTFTDRRLIPENIIHAGVNGSNEQFGQEEFRRKEEGEKI